MGRPEPAWRPLPREGVNASRVVVGGGAPPTLLEFLNHRLPAGQPWAPRLAQGEVLGETGQPLSAEARCRPGQLLWYWRRPPPEHPVPFEIAVLHQDAHLVVVDKPHFLPVVPGGRYLQETVLVRLQRQLGLHTLAPMHRLDRDTAGVLVFTVQPATRAAYQSLLRDRQVHKVYEAIAPWRTDLDLPLSARHRLQEPAGDGFMQMQVVQGEPNAFTEVECLARIDAAPPCPGAAVDPGQPGDGRPAAALGLYRLTPLTGRKHQLRAQMNALGLPIVGDRIYPTLRAQPAADEPPDYARPLQLLARSLAFTDPFSGQRRCFSSQRRLQLAPERATDA